jgi:hypothetical protein
MSCPLAVTTIKIERESMKKNRGKNPVFVFCSLLIPWRLIHTYFAIDDDHLYLSRYYANKANNFFKRKVDRIRISDIVKVDFNEKRQEPKKTNRYGTYKSQEISFLLKDQTSIGWSCRPYTKNQVMQLIHLLSGKNDNIFGKNLQKR